MDLVICTRRVVSCRVVSSLIKGLVVIFTRCGDFCGVLHHKSKSPQILVVIFVAVSPRVQITTSICGDIIRVWVIGPGHNENVANTCDSMCTLYLE